jgi:hypothetical protein
MADQICAQAKAAGFKTLLGSVDVSAQGADTSLQVLIAYGMKLYCADNNVIYMVKEL